MIRLGRWYAGTACAIVLATFLLAGMPAGAAFWENADDVGGGWRWLPWLGYFNVTHAPWIYHFRHGWVYPEGADSRSLYLWDQEMRSFWWTSDSVYPHLFRFSDQSWLWYERETGAPRRFHNYRTGRWENWGAGAGPKILLLLHGMNMTPDSWNDLDDAMPGSFGTIFDGVVTADAQPDLSGVRGYRLRFGAHDGTSGFLGLDPDGGETLAAAGPSNGDFSSFDQLGDEVRAAVARLLLDDPDALLLLVGHSRGGLAARAFLQNPAWPAAERTHVVALVTLGTPHLGSHLGRTHSFFKAHPRNSHSADRDWEAADFIRSESGLDVSRPAVKYLADDSAAIADLNARVADLPSGLAFGILRFEDVEFGYLGDRMGLTYKLWNEYPAFWGDPRRSISDAARAWLLGGAARASLAGDGIVDSASQRLHELAGFPGQLAASDSISGILHKDQQAQSTRIRDILTRTVDWWNQPKQAAATPISTAKGGGTVPSGRRPASRGPTPPAPLHADLDIPADRQEYFDDLACLDPMVLFSLWTEMDLRGHERRRALVGEALAQRLAALPAPEPVESPSLRPAADPAAPEFFRAVRDFLRDEGRPGSERLRCLKLLGRIPTPESLIVLAAFLTPDADAAFKVEALDQIRDLSVQRRGRAFREELSPCLEALWPEVRRDAGTAPVVAQALASIGTPSGVRLLLDELGLWERYRTAPWEPDGVACLAAWAAMAAVRNPRAVPVLSAERATGRPNSLRFRAAGRALSAVATAN